MIDKSFQALIISLLIHGFLTLAIFLTQDRRLSSSPTPIDVVYLDPDENKPQSIVTETEESADPLLEKVKEEADQLSRFTKRVKKQMQARKAESAPSSKPSPPAQTSSQAASQEDPQKTKPETPQDDLDLGIAQGRVAVTKPSKDQAESTPLALPGRQSNGLERNIVIGHSGLREYIPNVDEGSFTSLNTDQFMFYSFFSRINEQLRPRWVNNIRRFAGQQSLEELERLALVPRVTSIEVVLDQEGYLERVLVRNSSGSDGLDHAAAQAFRLAAPLLNPPQEMIEADGFIHLYYNFRVDWRPRHVVGR